MCAAHFRADACRAKRCRHSHACSIALMRGVECKDLNSSAEAIMIEPLVIKVADIASLSRSDYAMIHFLFLDNLCIFDHANEKNWKTWTNGFKVERGDLLTEVDSKLSALPPITEVDEATDAGVVLVTAQSSELSDDAIKTSHHSSSKSSLTLQPDRVIFKILSFCSDLDICRVNETCTYLNIAISNDELLVYRKREYLSSIRLTGKDLSKMKKQEKKKKIKAANYNKLPKKDAYRV